MGSIGMSIYLASDLPCLGTFRPTYLSESANNSLNHFVYDDHYCAYQASGISKIPLVKA
jgi:hypothetical protein